jgi:hypothetical protein
MGDRTSTYHIDMVILDVDTGFGLMIWEMTVWIWSSPILMWDILSLCLEGRGQGAEGHVGVQQQPPEPPCRLQRPLCIAAT